MVHAWEEGPEKSSVQVLEMGLGSQVLEVWSRRREHELGVATSALSCGLLALYRAMQTSQIQASKAQDLSEASLPYF